MVQDLNPDRGKKVFSFQKSSDRLWRFIQRVPAFFLAGKTAGAWSSLFTCI